jgi:hypothetical protein
MKVTHFGYSGQAGSGFAGDQAAASVIYPSHRRRWTPLPQGRSSHAAEAAQAHVVGVKSSRTQDCLRTVRAGTAPQDVSKIGDLKLVQSLAHSARDKGFVKCCVLYPCFLSKGFELKRDRVPFKLIYIGTRTKRARKDQSDRGSRGTQDLRRGERISRVGRLDECRIRSPI